MNQTQKSIGNGVPGSFPLPVSGAPGNAVAQNLKMHPAAAAALPARQNPINAGLPSIAGPK